MAEDRSEPRETNWRQLLPWTILFQGFRVALDPSKLALAAAGILAMAFGWWLLAVIFQPAKQAPQPADYFNRSPEDPNKAWNAFKSDYQHWSLMYEMAGGADPTNPQERDFVGAGDLADTYDEYKILKPIEEDLRGNPPKMSRAQAIDRLEKLYTDKVITRRQLDLWKPRFGLERTPGRLRTLPWLEDRGPNPYLLVTGQARTTTLDPGQTVLNWFITEQVPVLIEPLVKLFAPVVYFFNSRAGLLARFYLLLVMVWTLAVWALFGGAITRIAAVQLTRQEKIGAVEAVRFTLKRYVSYLTAPLFPLGIVALIVLVMIIFGLFHTFIPLVGDIVVDGLFWWIPVLLGLAMAVVLVGLVGWPLMSATISTEGTDTWEAVSRSYSYVFQAPWHYIFYSVVALVYGAVVVFFVGFMGSFMVYLAKWGVSQTPGVQWRERDPAYLFVYAPTSFQWRALLLQGGKAYLPAPDNKTEVRDLTVADQVNEPVRASYINEGFHWWNHVGAFLVAVWLYVIFLLILGFGYSYFWSASTIIYLLMRRQVDDAELDEVYLEEEDQDLPYAPPPGPAAAPPDAPSPTMVEAPTLRTPAPSVPAPVKEEPAGMTNAPRPAPPASPPAPSGDGGATPMGGTSQGGPIV